MQFDYGSTLVSQGTILFPDYPFAYDPVSPSQVADSTVITGTSTAGTIGIQGTV